MKVSPFAVIAGNAFAASALVALDERGKTIAEYDVRLDCSGCPEKINTHPHGLGVGPARPEVRTAIDPRPPRHLLNSRRTYYSYGASQILNRRKAVNRESSIVNRLSGRAARSCELSFKAVRHSSTIHD